MQGVATGRNEESSQRQGSAQRAEDEEELAVRVRMMVGRLNRRLERTTAGAGLTSTETVILSTTARRGPVGVSQIAAAEGMNPTMLSRVVRRLEDAGLIVRHGHPEDGRAVVLEATQAGHRLHDAIRAERSDTLSAQLEQLSPAQMAALLAGLPVLESVAEGLKGRRP